MSSIGKLIIFSAPSGSGKSTLINHVVQSDLGLEFSISATSRAPRGKEKNGVEYYFFSTEEFENKINNNEFIEYEEVYPSCYYGTLRSEINRIFKNNHTVLFDVDVIGGINLKKIFGNNALSIFIAPPSIDELRKRLEERGTDSVEMIEKRVGKAEFELSFAKDFDVVILNDNIEDAKHRVEAVIREFVNSADEI